MGKLSCGCHWNIIGRNSKLKQNQPGDMESHNIEDHEGIRTVDVETFCNFSTGSHLCVCIITWNLNGKVSFQDLVEIVGSDDGKFDLLVVGLQEVPKIDVARLLQEALVETHSLVGKSIMQSLQLFVFGPKNYEHAITGVKADKFSVGGFGGLIRRKKGAVAIRLRFKGIRMVFITCHLSAHEGNVEQRNSQLHHISQSLLSKNRDPSASPPEITVWLGDLNYRIQGIDTFPVRNIIKKDLHTMLTGNDQLLQEADRGNIFNGYCEGTLDFKPTYKYNVGSSNYDTSDKVRIPSWTDRILFKIEKHVDIEAALHSYESIDYIDSSDHKPVIAHLCLTVKKQIPSTISEDEGQ